jgi:hypothetical protein
MKDRARATRARRRIRRFGWLGFGSLPFAARRCPRALLVFGQFADFHRAHRPAIFALTIATKRGIRRAMLRRRVTEKRQRNQEPGESNARERPAFSNAQEHGAMMSAARAVPKWFRGFEYGGTWSYNRLLYLIVITWVSVVVRSLVRKPTVDASATVLRVNLSAEVRSEHSVAAPLRSRGFPRWSGRLRMNAKLES